MGTRGTHPPHDGPQYDSLDAAATAPSSRTADNRSGQSPRPGNAAQSAGRAGDGSGYDARRWWPPAGWSPCESRPTPWHPSAPRRGSWADCHHSRCSCRQTGFAPFCSVFLWRFDLVRFRWGSAGQPSRIFSCCLRGCHRWYYCCLLGLNYQTEGSSEKIHQQQDRALTRWFLLHGFLKNDLDVNN